MPDSKHLRWVDDYSTEGESQSEQEPVSSAASAANDEDGWQQYRQWISKAPAPRGRRAGIDPALYTWKGYRSWSEKIKRNWDPNSSNDSD